MKPRKLPPTPATIRAARMLFPKANRKRIREAAATIDYCTHLSSMVRTCAIVFRALEPPDSRRKMIARGLAKYSLRAAIEQNGYGLDELGKIIG
jgi:hypothetical protein